MERCNLCKRRKGPNYDVSDTGDVSKIVYICDPCLAKINQIKEKRIGAGKKTWQRAKEEKGIDTTSGPVSG